MNQIDSKTLDELDQYINGKLSDVQKEILEARLKVEPDLKEWLEWLKDSSKGMEDAVIDDHKAMVKSWIEDDKATSQSSNSSTKRPLLLALLLGFLILVLYLVFQNSAAEKQTPLQLATNHLSTPYKSPTILRNTSGEGWQNSISLYANGKYQAFLEANAALINTQTANNEQKLYFALAHLYQSPPHTEPALGFLDELISTPSGYEEVALWHRSLLYISIDDIKKAKADLIAIKNRSNYKEKEVNELLDALS